MLHCSFASCECPDCLELFLVMDCDIHYVLLFVAQLRLRQAQHGMSSPSVRVFGILEWGNHVWMVFVFLPHLTH
jgi:hypothetical protein